MAALPRERVVCSRPFDKVGVDFGGPFTVKASKLKKAQSLKSYIAIFVCMATKAVHIELVSNLSTDAFLMTLKRFISRRGNPSMIFSDNASNFLGAKNQLREVHQFFKSKNHSDSVINFLFTNQTQWKFIPPRSPHWGGIWESAIKNAKYHMVRIIGNAHFTLEELSTTLTQIEAILNSRPLCPLSNDPSDLQCLTPGHFLIGRPLTAYPDQDVTHVPDNRLKFFQRLAQIQQLFWKRWSINYLNLLQNRPKWLTPSPNLKVNDLMLVKEDNTVPLHWPLARVVQVMPGSDGRVRIPIFFPDLATDYTMLLILNFSLYLPQLKLVELHKLKQEVVQMQEQLLISLGDISIAPNIWTLFIYILKIGGCCKGHPNGSYPTPMTSLEIGTQMEGFTSQNPVV
ncbi:uncharacterized protein [Euwallacea similis]|uniref:uncharacterized protein n=1 Tax=Euwallacea similis TaxID=1736056 RepID=UPI00344C63C6